MKGLLFSFFALLFCQFAWSQQVVEQPEYGFRSSAIYSIEKVELSSEYTKIHILSEFMPGWWVVFQQAKITLESKSPAFQLSPISLEGAKWGEKKTTPKEGINRFILTFPAIPAETECFDYVDGKDRIIDVRLKGKSVSPLFEGVPQALIGNWFSSKKGWEYGFYEDMAILKEDFYVYRQVEKKGKWLRILLENKQNESAEVWVKAEKDGRYLIGVDKQTAGLYASVYTSAGLPTQAAGEAFFQAGRQTTLRGFIRGYKPSNGERTTNLILHDGLGMSPVNSVIEFQEDGTFEVSFSSSYPRFYSFSPTDFGSIPFYCEPGRVTMLYIEWEDYLKADRYRNASFYDFSSLAYMGVSARTASDLFVCQRVLPQTLQLYRTKLSAKEKEKRFMEHFQFSVQKLDSLYRSEAIGEQGYRVQKGALDARFMIEVIDLYQWPESEEDKEVARAFDLQVFLSPFDLSNPFLYCHPFSYFLINRLKYANCFKKKYHILNGTPEMNFATYVLTKAPEMLTPEREKMLAFVKDGADYIRLKDTLWMKEFHRCNDSLRVWEDRYPEIKASYDKVYGTPPRYSLAEKCVKVGEFMKREYGCYFKKPFDLTGEAIVLSQTVDTRGDQLDSTEAMDSVVFALDGLLVTPYLKAELQEYHRRYMERSRRKGYILGNSRGEELFKKILEPHRGKVVLVDFWGIFCGPCMSGIKNSVEMRQQMKEEDVAFVFVTSEGDSPKDRYDEFVDLYLSDYPSHRLVNDEYNYIKAFFNISGIPRYMLVDREGRILNDAYHMHRFEYQVEELLREK